MIEDELRAYYAADAAPVDAADKARVVRLIAAEAAGQEGAMLASETPFWRFVAGQLRFVSPVAWAMQAALLAALLAVVLASGFGAAATLFAMSAAVLSVALAIPSVFRSFDFRMDELEYSCRHDCVQVLAARLVLFGLADVLWLSIVVAVAPSFAESDPFRVFLYACTPFFAFCAASFHIARLRRGDVAKSCAVAACVVVAAIWAAGAAFPHWYAELSVLAWTGALVAAVALAAYEARRLVAHLSAGVAVRGAPDFA